MMIDLIERIQDAGYMVTIAGDDIVLDYRGDEEPDETLVKPLIDELRINKYAVIARLQAGKAAAGQTQSRTEDSQVKTAPRSGAGVMSHLVGLVHDAQDWQDLERVTDATEAAFKRGKISQAEAEAVASLAVGASRTLPEEIERQKTATGFFGPDADYWWAALEAHRRGLKYIHRSLIERERRLRQKEASEGRAPSLTVPIGIEEYPIAAEDLMPGPDDVCLACGQASWSTKVCGQRVCGVCDPESRKHSTDS